LNDWSLASQRFLVVRILLYPLFIPFTSWIKIWISF